MLFNRLIYNMDLCIISEYKSGAARLVSTDSIARKIMLEKDN